jgi:hypothetical protein
MVRTSDFLVAPLRLYVAGDKKAEVIIFGALSLVLSLDEQRKNEEIYYLRDINNI